MKEQKISLPTAKLAIEKGFEILGNQAGFIMSKPEVLNLPSQTILQKWLREVHNIIFFVFVKGNEGWVYTWTYHQNDFSKTIFKSYEDALEEALFESLKRIK